MKYFQQQKLFLISGPCVIENYELLQVVCGKLKEITHKLNIEFVFKASFDKANRSSIDSFRGPGLIKGLEMLGKIKKEFEVDVLSDVHTPEMIQDASEVLDIIQIPAFLARQTDFYAACAKNNCIVNVKKGQFMAPAEMENVINKFKQLGGEEIFITERGSFFGYGNLVVDYRSIKIIKDLGVPYIYDATHSLQHPAAAGTQSGGDRRFLAALSKGQLAAGADGLFIESHNEVEKARSDAATQYPLEKMESLLSTLNKLYHFCKREHAAEQT